MCRTAKVRQSPSLGQVSEGKRTGTYSGQERRRESHIRRSEKFDGVE